MRYFDRKTRFLFATALVVTISSITACGEKTIEEEDARPYVDQWSETVEDSLRSRAVLAAGSEALETRLREASKADERQIQRDEPPFDLIVTEVYEGREFEPGFVDEQGLSPRAVTLWETLQGVEDHRLDPEPYRLDDIAEAIEKLERQLGTVDTFEGLAATEEDRHDALSWLVEQPISEFELSPDNYERLIDELLADDSRGDRLQEALEQYQQKRSSIAEAGAVVEHLLATGLARYAREQRHFRIKEIFVHTRHWDYYNEQDVENSGPRPDPERGAFLAGQIWRDAAHLTEAIAEENEAQILHGKIAQTLVDLLESEDPEAVVDAIPPQQPQYAGLVAEYRRYRDIVEAGGWQEVQRTNNLAPGRSHSVIAALKERLRIEGYFPEDLEIDDVYDEHLTEAIEEYQKTHQLQVTGRPHNVFWTSLNIPAERRLAQIALNMERWRKTNVRHELPSYVFVNIPDFNIELWHEQQRLKRFATIVGDNEKSINPLTDEAEHANRTPTPMAAYIDRIIFNPYWNVTERIRAVRILPEVKESIERKYALRFTNLMAEHQREQARRQAADETPLAALGRGGWGARRQETSEGDSGGEAADDSDEDEESSAPSNGDSEQGESSEEPLSEEELLAEKRNRSLQEWTETRRVYNEEQERYEQRRFFHVSKLRNLESTLHADDQEAIAAFRENYPYLDWDTGEVDVESTHPDHIPSWYEQNDYEVVHPGRTWEYVRMLPGPSNALGFVKIIFPNLDNIYLHDTPARELFRSTIRGFSHGCIRLERPLQLSEALLELDGKDVDIDKILRDEEYLPIFLDRQIPVFLEYYTVTVDDEGRANFLADIYDYDDEELERLLQ